MEWVLSSLIPSLVKEGIFGDVEFKDLQSDDNKNIGAQFASTLAFVKLIVQRDSREQIFPLVIKTPMPERSEDGRAQFMMESLMYKEVLSILGFKQVCYPKIYYSNVSLDNPNKNVLIFENVKYKHYQNSKSRTFLDFNHISVALKTLARFHALSFILKHENIEKFHQLTSEIKKYSYDPKTYSIYDIPIHAAIERGVRGFEKRNGADEVLKDFLRAVKNPAELRCQLSMPDEPFDVICHGDFCNNNVMYKYNEEGSPTDCIFYDFQLSIYGNVAVELAFFLYMHTNFESREKYWDSLLKIYWETLRETVPDNIYLPTYEDFIEYFGSRAVLGYIISSFFLPMLMDPNASFWGNLPMDEQIALMKSIGGDEAEKAIVDVVYHIHEKKYIHKFLKYMKAKKYFV